MFVNNVNDYAPEGYRLAASNMEQGKCSHVFVAEGKPELRCGGSWGSADEERAALERFKGAFEPLDSIPWTVPGLARDAEERLRAALDEGDASPVSPDYSLGKVLDKVYAAGDHGLPPAKPKAAPKKR
jgi:hypothetical protein